ncbi:hypothetical protein OTU49_009862, partial [Cherax quadricarinatus]
NILSVNGGIHSVKSHIPKEHSDWSTSKNLGRYSSPSLWPNCILLVHQMFRLLSSAVAQRKENLRTISRVCPRLLTPMTGLCVSCMTGVRYSPARSQLCHSSLPSFALIASHYHVFGSLLLNINHYHAQIASQISSNDLHLLVSGLVNKSLVK